jgi:chemotaxis protein MotB
MTSEDLESPRPPSRRGAWLLCILLFWIAAGLGVYGWQLRAQHLAVERVLTSTNGDLVSLRTQKAALETKMAALTAERERLSSVDGDLRDAKTRLAATESRLRELEEQHSEVEARLREFREVTAKFRELIDAGTLEVTFRRGRMIVELPAGVLFDSGSADLSEQGKKAVTDVAHVLAQVSGRRYIVAGHTDNVPAVKEFKSNWALSAARAVTVLEALIRAGMPATRVAAAGYAEYDPIAPNLTTAGRQRNRRIEIILEPYLVAIPGEEKGAGGMPATTTK